VRDITPKIAATNNQSEEAVERPQKKSGVFGCKAPFCDSACNMIVARFQRGIASGAKSII